MPNMTCADAEFFARHDIQNRGLNYNNFSVPAVKPFAYCIASYRPIENSWIPDFSKVQDLQAEYQPIGPKISSHKFWEMHFITRVSSLYES